MGKQLSRLVSNGDYVAVREVTALVLSGYSLYLLYKMTRPFLQDSAQDRLAQQNLNKLIKHRGPELAAKVGKLSSEEAVWMGEVVFPDQISVTFDSIGGLDSLKQLLQDTILKPLISSADNSLPQSRKSLMEPPKGALFHGPPGTGKSMMAKAIAKSSGAVFINVSAANFQSKWYGETPKLIDGLFSLAKKLSPAIIFIDEVDVFFRKRGSSFEHDVTLTSQAMFLSLWDGLMSDFSEHRIMILGATNRISIIDEAFLRRMPRRFKFTLPDEAERLKILKAILKDEKLESVELQTISEISNGYSGSDLYEVCKFAISSAKGDLTTEDLLNALETIQPPQHLTGGETTVMDLKDILESLKA